MCCAVCNVLSCTLLTKVCGTHRAERDALCWAQCAGQSLTPRAVRDALFILQRCLYFARPLPIHPCSFPESQKSNWRLPLINRCLKQPVLVVISTQQCFNGQRRCPTTVTAELTVSFSVAIFTSNPTTHLHLHPYELHFLLTARRTILF